MHACIHSFNKHLMVDHVLLAKPVPEWSEEAVVTVPVLIGLTVSCENTDKPTGNVSSKMSW